MISFFPPNPSIQGALEGASATHHLRAHSQYCYLGHAVLWLLESIPVLGTLVALVECAIANALIYLSQCFCDNEEPAPDPPSDEESEVEEPPPDLEDYPTQELMPRFPSPLPQVILTLIQDYLPEFKMYNVIPFNDQREPISTFGMENASSYRFERDGPALDLSSAANRCRAGLNLFSEVLPSKLNMKYNSWATWMPIFLANLDALARHPLNEFESLSIHLEGIPSTTQLEELGQILRQETLPKVALHLCFPFYNILDYDANRARHWADSLTQLFSNLPENCYVFFKGTVIPVEIAAILMESPFVNDERFSLSFYITPIVSLPLFSSMITHSRFKELGFQATKDQFAMTCFLYHMLDKPLLEIRFGEPISLNRPQEEPLMNRLQELLEMLPQGYNVFINTEDSPQEIYQFLNSYNHPFPLFISNVPISSLSLLSNIIENGAFKRIEVLADPELHFTLFLDPDSITCHMSWLQNTTFEEGRVIIKKCFETFLIKQFEKLYNNNFKIIFKDIEENLSGLSQYIDEMIQEFHLTLKVQYVVS